MDSKSPSLKTRSYASSTSTRSSGRSSGRASAAAAKARADAEAAKARLLFAEREMKLKIEKAHLEASMEMLTIEKEAAAAVAKAEAFEAVVEASEGKHSCKLPLIATSLDPAKRTKDYLEKQSKVSEDIQMAPQEDSSFHHETRQSPLELPLHSSVHMPRLNT